MEGRPTDDGVAPRHEPRRDQLYAVSDGGMIAEISMAGTPAVPTFAGGPGPPMALIRVEAVQAP